MNLFTNGFKVALVGLAILGLTFSVDSQSTIASTTNGIIQTPDLSQIYPELNSTANSETIGAQQYVANKYVVVLSELNLDMKPQANRWQLWRHGFSISC